MSRWIDADVLHDALKAKQKWVVRCGDKHNEGYTYDQVHFAIDDAPSIEVIHCRECKHWKESQYYPEVMACTYVKGATFTRQHDDFCSRGERKEDE